jgi:hypothetical protein
MSVSPEDRKIKGTCASQSKAVTECADHRRYQLHGQYRAMPARLRRGCIARIEARMPGMQMACDEHQLSALPAARAIRSWDAVLFDSCQYVSG